MSTWTAIMDPLQGKTSLGKVIWGYGLLGSILYGAIELLLNPANEPVMRAYVIGGLIFSIYVTVATYRCAVHCRSPFLRRAVRVSAVISLVLLPVIAYLDLTGALTLVSLGGEQLPE